MVEVSKGIQTRIHIMASFNLVKRMAKGSIHGLMERSMTVNGILVSSMDMEFGKDFMGTLTLVSGGNQRLRDMESITGRTVIDMRESGNNA